MENKNNNVLGNLTEINNGKVVTNRNKQNNINKVIKQVPKKKTKVKSAYTMQAHEGIEELKLLETTPTTPRESFMSIYNKGQKILYDVTFFVKGYLPDSDDSMVTVENICWTKLLSWHCNIIVEDNPEIVEYIGKIITCDIEIYPYPSNPDKYSFNIISEPSYVENQEYYDMISWDVNVPRFEVNNINAFMNGIMKLNIEYKLKYVDDIVAHLEALSELYYNNQSVILNLVLNTLFMSTDIDRKILSDSLFINKYFYDIMMILTKLIDKIVVDNVKDYTKLIETVLYVIGLYTNSPYINNYKNTQEFVATRNYLNVSSKQANFYYLFLIKSVYEPVNIDVQYRKKELQRMKQMVIDWCMSVPA